LILIDINMLGASRSVVLKKYQATNETGDNLIIAIRGRHIA